MYCLKLYQLFTKLLEDCFEFFFSRWCRKMQAIRGATINITSQSQRLVKSKQRFNENISNNFKSFFVTLNSPSF